MKTYKLYSLCVTIIFFLILISPIYPQYCVNINNSKNIIKSVKIGEIDFIDYHQLIKLFAPQIKINKNSNVVETENFSSTANPNNFFMILKSDSITKIIQFNVPTITKDGNIYIPIKSFVSGLATFLDFNYDIVDNAVFIETNENFNNFFNSQKNTNENINENKLQSKTEIDTVSNADINKQKKLPKNKIEMDTVSKTTVTKKKISKDTIKSVAIPKLDTIEHNNEIGIHELNNNFDKIDGTKKSSAIVPLEENIKNHIIIPEYLTTNTQISKSKIEKLGFEKDNIDLFYPEKTDTIKNDILNNIKMLNLPKLNNKIMLDNPALPPFRKYSIPDTLKKRKLEELGD